MNIKELNPIKNRATRILNCKNDKTDKIKE
jgi:hypothetical protein